MKKCILIVGQKISNLVNYLDANGYDYIVLKDRKRTKFLDKKFKRRILCDFSNQETVLAAIDSIKKPVHAVIATFETYILPAAWIADHLGLPGIPIKSAEACTDKYIMRSLFSLAPEKISPDFNVILTEDDLRDFASRHSFPLIIKPANLSKSLLVTKNHDLNELLINYRNTMNIIDDTYQKYAPDRKPKLIIEEFMEVTIHSIDAFVDKNGVPNILEQVVDYKTGYDIGYDDNFHFSRTIPSKLSLDEQKALRHCADVGIRSLNMCNSPAHVEIIMTSDGPRIVEIGARNGGYRDRMHKLANGIDITKAALGIALGSEFSITKTRSDSCAVLELFPRTKGIFREILQEEMIHNLPSLQYCSLKVRPGDIIGKSSDGYKASLIIILHSPDHEKVANDVLAIQNNVEIITDPITKGA